MKALKSERAKLLLADPLARAQLRHFMAGKSDASSPAANAPVRIALRGKDGRVEFVEPRVVPKAA